MAVIEPRVLTEVQTVLTESGGRTGPARQGRDRAGRPAAGSRKVVLLIEDNEADRDLYGSLLWYNGFDVLHAPNGEQGISKALDRSPDLILLDLHLPGGPEGLEVLERIREAGSDTPVIALTATPREEIGESVNAFLSYLEKPITPFEVVREVQRRIGSSRVEPTEPTE